MSDRVVVYSNTADAEDVRTVAGRLRSNGIDVVDEQTHMLLVVGSSEAIRRALGDARGWQLTEPQPVERPRTRERILKPPS